MAGPEARFQKKAMLKFRALPKSWWAVTQPVSIRGLPDNYGCVNGIFVWLEFKKNKKEAERTDGRHALQNFNREHILNIGGYAIKIYPDNFQMVSEDLEAISEAENPGLLLDMECC